MIFLTPFISESTCIARLMSINLENCEILSFESLKVNVNVKNGTVLDFRHFCLKSKMVRYRFWTEMSKIEKRYRTAISRPILELFGLK